MDWLSGESQNKARTTTYGKKKTTSYGSKSSGGSVSFTSLSSIGEDVDDFDFSRTNSIFGASSNLKRQPWGVNAKATPLRDTSGNIPQIKSIDTDDSVGREKNTRSSKRTTETPLSSSSNVKVSRSSPTGADIDEISMSVIKGSSIKSSSRRNTARRGKDVDFISTLETGRPVDVEYLKNSMDSATFSCFSGLQIKAPKWESAEQAILRSWLEKLGFEAQFLSFTMVFRLRHDKAEVFKREFAVFYAKYAKEKSRHSFGLELDMESSAFHTSENLSKMSGSSSSSSSRQISSSQVKEASMNVQGLSHDDTNNDGRMNLVNDIVAQNISEEKLWIQETLGNEDHAPEINENIKQESGEARGTKHSAQAPPRINILRCSFDSDDISSTCSTPGSSGIHRADQLSPVSQTPGGPEMNRVLSGVTSGMDNLALRSSSTDLTSLHSNASSSSLSTLVESAGEMQEHEAIPRVGTGEGFKEGNCDDDSQTESEGEDVNESEYMSHDDQPEILMSATFPPRQSYSSASSQKVWFGSVQQMEGSPGMAMAFDPSLNRSRSSCESPYAPASSRLSIGSNDGSDGNPGFMSGFNRSFARRNVDKHPNARRPPAPRNISNPNRPKRSMSDSDKHNIMHSTEQSAAAGAVTPGGPCHRIRPIGKEFSTPNSVIGKIKSGEPGDYDWGITTASCGESIRRLTELLNSYDIPPSNDCDQIKPVALRRHVTMDDRILSRRSPSGFVSRNNFRQDMMAGESPTPNITPATGRQNLVSIIPAADEDVSSIHPYHMGHHNMQASVPGNAWLGLDEQVVAQAKKALSLAQNLPFKKSADSFVPTEIDGIAEGNEEEMDEDVVSDLNTATVSIRDKKRVLRSAAVKRRMSMCMKNKSVAQWGRRSNLQHCRFSLVANVLSPATPAKCRGKSSKGKDDRHGSRLSPIMYQDSLMEGEDGEQEEANAFQDSSHEFMLCENSHLSERNFKGHVIGGVYQHSFDDFKPVVAPPAASDQRIIDVNLKQLSDGDSSLEIKLFVSKDKECKYIDLGPQWIWTRTAQDGYLVCSEPFRPSKEIVCYYLSRHPLEWANSNVENKHSPRSPHLADMSFMSGFCQPTPDRDHEFSPDNRDFLDKYGMVIAGQDEDEFKRNLKFVDAPVKNWDNPNIACTILEYLFDPRFMDAGISMYRLVSKSWAIGSYKLLANHLSEIGNCQQMNQRAWISFMRAYNWGKFLSSGACKDVYIVQDNSGRTNAVSVMNIEDLMKRDMELAIKQEIEVALLCSSLVSLNICPNLVIVHSIFQSSHGVSDALWRSNRPRPDPADRAAQIVPRTSKKTKGLYQFIRMEFCNGGDLEETIRTVGVLDLHLVKKMLFQMCFSLYACREQIGLRHYDIKLLNFFVTDGSALTAGLGRQQMKNPVRTECIDETVVMHIAFGEHDFVLPMQAKGRELIKLSDFGTSSVGPGDLGEPITMQQLTTLENTPPEFLILGSVARQAYSADTFCLGLSFLHLLTGEEPYEVLLEDVRCPPYLATQLSKYWCDFKNTDVNDPYHLICDLVKSLDMGEGDVEMPGTVLFDTIYRYIVLFSGSEDFLVSFPWVDNPVWMLIVDALGLDAHRPGDMERKPMPKKGRGRPKRGGSPTARSESIATYQYDFSLWSIHRGTHPKIVRVQSRLNQLGDGSWKLFDKMTHFDPARRCKMHEAIMNPIFNDFRVEQSGVEHTLASNLVSHASFTTYRRSVDEGGTDALPLL